MADVKNPSRRLVHRQGRGVVALALIAGVAAACGGRAAPPDDRLASGAVDTRASPWAVPGVVSPDQAASAHSHEAADGRILFESACGVCHDRSGQGSPGKGPSLRASAMVPAAPDLLIRIVLDGVRQTGATDGSTYALPMPSWRVLADRDLAAILSHVRHTFGGGSSPVAAEDVARVRTATAGRSRAWTFDELHRLAATRRRR